MRFCRISTSAPRGFTATEAVVVVAAAVAVVTAPIRSVIVMIGSVFAIDPGVLFALILDFGIALVLRVVQYEPAVLVLGRDPLVVGVRVVVGRERTGGVHGAAVVEGLAHDGAVVVAAAVSAAVES